MAPPPNMLLAKSVSNTYLVILHPQQQPQHPSPFLLPFYIFFYLLFGMTLFISCCLSSWSLCRAQCDNSNAWMQLHLFQVLYIQENGENIFDISLSYSLEVQCNGIQQTDWQRGKCYCFFTFNICETWGLSTGVLLGWDITKVLSEHLKNTNPFISCKLPSLP